MNLLSHWHFTSMQNKMEKAVLKSSQDGLDARQKTRRNYIISSMSKTAILRDYGFSLVTCADWMWESISWLMICLTIQTGSCFIFGLLWFLWHMNKAGERHANYQTEFQL